MSKLTGYTLPPLAHPQIENVEMQVYGARSRPLGRSRIPLAHLKNFEAAYEGFRAVYPQYTMEQFVRYVFAKGVHAAAVVVHSRQVPAPRAFYEQ